MALKAADPPLAGDIDGRTHARRSVAIPGWDVAGVVREDAEGFRAGDRVAAMPLARGFAETVAVDARMVFRCRPRFRYEQRRLSR